MIQEAGSVDKMSLSHYAGTLLQLAVPSLPVEQRVRWMPIALSLRGRGGKIFLAYTHRDSVDVGDLVEQLKRADLEAWYDRNLRGQGPWTKELERQIERARAVVVVLSARSRDSDWVEREVLYAMNHGVPVVLFLLERLERGDLPIWATNLPLARNSDELIRMLRATGRLPYSPSYEVLSELAEAAGVRLVLCLVDEVDEVSGIEEQSQMLSLLSCLMAPELRRIDNLAFRYFLPASLEEPLSQNSRLRLDRCHVEHLHWKPDDLKRLIRQRMIAFSEDKRAPYESLGQLCDPSDGFAARIDDELVELAEGNPRAAVFLADRMLRYHCRKEDPPRLIQADTWEEVKEKWWRVDRERIVGAANGEQPFRVWGDQILFQGRKITLSGRSYALLRCLVEARGHICSMEELKRAGWPEDKPEGVTEGALNEAIRRLRQKLDEKGIDPRWVENVRGQGYRIARSLEKSGR